MKSEGGFPIGNAGWLVVGEKAEGTVVGKAEGPGSIDPPMNGGGAVPPKRKGFM